MNSLRKWLYRPRKDDPSLMAQFYYADDELNAVAAELDSFDGRKDPERCTALVNQLRQCQDRVLNICVDMMEEIIPEERATRDFRVKFPDDVMQENLAGQLWFGAECLAAGSSIMNREAESSRMRPLAKAVTKKIETVRNLLREQCLKPLPEYTEKIRESLKIFDRLFSEFELSYVSAMVPVKSVEEHDVQQNVVVLFSETLQRSLHLQLISQDQIDDYDPALMFTIPRLAIVAGLVIFPDGPLNLDRDPRGLSELFRPFRTLLAKIRELLWTMSAQELAALEKALCSMDEPNPCITQEIAQESVSTESYGLAAFTSDFVQKFYNNYPSCKYLTPELSLLYQNGKKPERYERKRERTSVKNSSSRSKARQERQSERFLARLNGVEERPRAQRRRSKRNHSHRVHQNPPPPPPPDSDSERDEQPTRQHSAHRDHGNKHHPRIDHGEHSEGLPTSHRHSRQHRSSKPRHHNVHRIKSIACSCGSSGVTPASQSVYNEQQQPFNSTLDRSHQEGGEFDTSSSVSYVCDNNCDERRQPTLPPVETSPCVCSSSVSSNVVVAGPAVLSNDNFSENSQIQQVEYSENQLESITEITANIEISCKEEESSSVQSYVCDPNKSTYQENLLETSKESSSDHVSNLRSVELDTSGSHEVRGQRVVGGGSSGSTSPYHSGAEDDEEVALALQAAEVAATWKARARFQDPQDLIHRLFVCISGVADQLQTNYASDLRKILKCVFLLNQTPPSPDEEIEEKRDDKEPTWSSLNDSYSNQEPSVDDTTSGNDSERLSVESAEDALVVIGSPERRVHVSSVETYNEDEDRSPSPSPETLSPLSPSTSPHSPLSPPGSPMVCPPSVHIPTAVLQDHALMQFSESALSYNNDLPAPNQVQYPESYGIIPEPMTRIAPEQSDIMVGSVSGVVNEVMLSDQGSVGPPWHHQQQPPHHYQQQQHPQQPQQHQHHEHHHEQHSVGSIGEGSTNSNRRRPIAVQDPPVWVPDHEAPRCMACGASFTMVRRRHHCRNCGKVFCAHCSQHAVPLPHYGIWKAVRVCNICFLYYVTFTTESTAPTTS